MLRRNTFRYFFTVYSNQHQNVKQLVEGKDRIYDHNLSEYGQLIYAFVTKRWIKKEEIPPKMFITPQISSIQSTLDQQALVDLKSLMDERRLERMYTSNEFNSQYLISITAEEHFKTMMDEYLQKVLVSGRVVRMEEREAYLEKEKKIKELYGIFFHGQGLSDLEREIEFQYLVEKQEKYLKYQKAQKMRDKCLWSYSQQRRIEGMANWVARDTEYFDDFRPIFEEIRKDRYEEYLKLSGCSRLEILKKTWFRNQKDYLVGLLLSRTLLYANSLEMIKLMRIPPDFYIESQIASIHVWMIANRLKSLGEKGLGEQLRRYFRNHLAQQFSKVLYIRGNNDIKDVEDYVGQSWEQFERCLVSQELNLYNLVWGVLLLEKARQKSFQVRLMAEYVKANFEFMQQVPLERILSCQVEFDVFRVDLDFEKRESEESYEEVGLLRLAYERGVAEKVVDELHGRLFYHSKKYMNLDYYDQLSKHEQDREDAREKSEKYAWVDSDSVASAGDVERVKAQIKNSRSN